MNPLNQDTYSEPLLSSESTLDTDGDDDCIANIGKRNPRYCDNHISTTRYNLWNFLPKSIFEQFRRLANVFFLLMSALMLLGKYTDLFQSSLNPYTTVGPLCIIVLLTCLKEGLEDLKRRRSDASLNERKVKLMRGSDEDNQSDGKASFEIFSQVAWKDIRVGDLVFLKEKDALPADILLIASSTENGSGGCTCFIETSNIDGETNLKLRESVEMRKVQVVKSSNGTGVVDEQQVEKALQSQFRGSMRFEKPNKSIETFVGALRLNEMNGASRNSWSSNNAGGSSALQEVIPCGPQNFMLRGSTLKNTAWVWGLCVYTGKDTKIMQNSRAVPSKISRMDKLTNKCIEMIIMFQIILTAFSTVYEVVFEQTVFDGKAPSYLGGDTTKLLLGERFGLFLTFFVLFNNVVPISLYVTIEVVNYGQAFLIDNDKEMYHEETDTPAATRSSSLIGDLGQVQWIFSDKTGTLTCNEMHLRQCFFPSNSRGGGPSFGETDGVKGSFKDDQLKRLFHGNRNGSTPITFDSGTAFFTALSLCHTVVAEEKSDNASETKSTSRNGNLCYRAESPDEAALVEGASQMGFIFLGRTGQNGIEIQLPNKSKKKYSLLAINEFNSTRKRMSVIVRDLDTQKIKIICKGADNMILSRCAKSEDVSKNGIYSQKLSSFAKVGLRTLVVGERQISEKEFNAWYSVYTNARASIVDRSTKLAEAAEKIEVHLKVLGVTAIEDRLQDGVDQTIFDLARAGIKLWVLTGDKQETAINIGYSCKLLQPAMTVVKLDGSDDVSVGTKLNNLCRTFGAIKRKQNLILQALEQITNAAHLVAGAVKTIGSIALHGAKPRGLESRALKPRSVGSEYGNIGDGSGKLALVITGKALEYILENNNREQDFVNLGQMCDVVIACRVSPLQKALIVRLMRYNAKSGGSTKAEQPMTLAIGDGANDVGMLLEAHLGIGISGKEGMQAVNNSDFAIAQFRYLRRLLLVHGRWNYLRSSRVFLYSFYKNIVLVFTMYWFLAYSAYSGQTLFTDWIYAGYNFYLGWPVVGIGLFNQDITAKTALKFPELYATGRLNLYLSVKNMFLWLTMAAATSIIIYFGGLLTWAGSRVQVFQSNSTFLDKYALVTIPLSGNDGQFDGYAAFGTMIFFCLIATMQCKALFETNTWNIWTFLFQAASWILFFVSIWILDVYSNVWGEEMTGIFKAVFGDVNTYFYVFLVICSLLVLEYFIEHFRLQYRPNAIDITREIDKGYVSLSSEQRAHSKTIAQRRKSSIITKKNNDLDAVIREAIDDNVDLGIIDGERRSSYAWDSPTIISSSDTVKSIASRRPSFGHVNKLESILDEEESIKSSKS